MKAGLRSPHLILAAIIVAYLVAGVQYARLTPPWQAPDEPAHFNYVKYVAEHGSLPVLQEGDFPAAYLARFTDPHNTPRMSIDPIRYESWQPPLYYLMAAVVYRLAPAQGQLLALRLLSVVVGALTIYVAYRAVAALAPGRTWLALGTAAFVAAVPMHVATTAAVSNDTLAELWVDLVLWQLFALLHAPTQRLRPWVWLGVTLGLAGLTKLSTAIVAPLALAALLWLARRRAAPGQRWRYGLARLALLCLPAALFLAPWLARNVAVYGPGDPLASQRHAQVAGEQLHTATRIAQVGWARVATEFMLISFNSFWGQFGWMGVPIDGRIYQGLAVFCELAAAGLVWRLRTLRRNWRALPEEERLGLGLLALLALLSAASLVGYNLTFVQPQGRYLFLALVPAGVFLSIGWRQIIRRALRPLVAGLLAGLALLLAARSALRAGPWDKWTLAGLAGSSAGLGLSAWLPERWSVCLYAVPYLLLLGLDFLCLHSFILPALWPH